MDYRYDPYLRLHLPLYQKDGAAFASSDVYGHLATVTGALWTPQGYTFDGTDDYITVPDHDSLDITQEITLEVWFKTSSVTANTGLISKFGGSAPEAYLWYIQNTGKVLEFAINSSTVKAGTTAVDDGKWHHTVLTYNRVEDICYLDGRVEFTHSFTTAINSTADDVIIGSETTTYGFLNGTIGEVRIYNRALSPLEVQRNYLITKRRYL